MTDCLRVPKVFESKFNLVFSVFSVDEVLLLVTVCLRSTGVAVLIEGVCDSFRHLDGVVSFGRLVRLL